MKRMFDFTAALFGIIASIPIVLIAMVAIRLDSPGSPIFAQTRVGRDEKLFTCLKLRTMHISTANVPTHETKASAVTSVGAFLRKFKLDELPQLLNVLAGEMSLVGPRPCLASQTQLIEARRLRGVFGVRPGITGLAQVMGVDMSDPERLAKIDGDYVRTQTFVGDLNLIVATLVGKGIGIDHVSKGS